VVGLSGNLRLAGVRSARFFFDMGRGRGREAILAALGTLAVCLSTAGCGSESHPNVPRPPLAAEVTVNVTDHAVQAQPAKVGLEHGNSAAIHQNVGKEPTANPKAPLVVNFTTVNTTTTDTTLEVHGPGGFEKRSGAIVAGGNDLFKTALPNGHYTLEAADLPGATPASFYVGPSRVSSQNDLLLP
jgi:hypothetical protein